MASKTTIKGEIACLKFEQRAIEKGAIVSRPSIECVYDRIIDYDGRLQKIQVKYADAKSPKSDGAVQAHIGKSGKGRGTHKPYEDEEIDAIVVYVPKADKVCWLGKEIWSGKVMLQLRFEPTKNNQKKGVRLVEDFIW